MHPDYYSSESEWLNTSIHEEIQPAQLSERYYALWYTEAGPWVEEDRQRPYSIHIILAPTSVPVGTHIYTTSDPKSTSGGGGATIPTVVAQVERGSTVTGLNGQAEWATFIEQPAGPNMGGIELTWGWEDRKVVRRGENYGVVDERNKEDEVLAGFVSNFMQTIID